MGRPLTTQEFIFRSHVVHNHKFDYSKTNYKNLYTKVVITCPVHGDFTQTPQGHLDGYGCRQCGYLITRNSKRKYNKNSFVKKALSVHNNKHDYSDVRYIDVLTKVKITCIEHNYTFYQSPSQHLKGKTGCPKCYLDKISKKKKYTLDGFIQKSECVHGYSYDYSLSRYNKSNDFVKIICPKHGMFEQRAVSHMSGVGCPKCARDRIDSAQRSNTNEFVHKAISTHGYKYNYSLVNYVNAKSKIPILCNTHGLFYQSPESHIGGCGCPKCATGKYENNIANTLTKLGVEYIRQFPIKYHTSKSLKFDFYLAAYNLMVEYNGGQHYYPVKYFGGHNKFIKQLKRDAIKKWYCIFNNIDLLVIPYWEKDVEGVLKHKIGLL